MAEITGFNRITENAKDALASAASRSASLNNKEVKAVHLFLAILAKPSTIISKLFGQFNLDLDNTVKHLEESIKQEPTYVAEIPRFAEQLKQVINYSFVIASRMDHVYVGVEHLFIAILESVNEPFVQELTT